MIETPRAADAHSLQPLRPSLNHRGTKGKGPEGTTVELRSAVLRGIRMVQPSGVLDRHRPPKDGFRSSADGEIRRTKWKIETDGGV